MILSNLAPILQTHTVFQGLKPDDIELLTDCASNVSFGAGDFIFRQGEAANQFYLLRQGRVAIEISAPGQKPIVIQTLRAQDVLGWSWLFPPYQWQFDARVLELTRAIALNGLCLRGKCDSDPALGYELMKRFSYIMLETLQATRLQLLDLHDLPRR
uniref:Cyclic nucleotide-binding protein n=1 Tax=Cyanothece sp. (strain PCC 7425 / ATCC 29141) TaxID=395961 RepID=B8HJR3_CYAP4